VPSAVLWLADCRAAGEADLLPFTDWMGPSERQRYAGFVRAERKRQFLIGRALIRWALSDLLQRSVLSFPIQERTGSSPFLGNDLPCVSLSHSGSWVACAVGPDVALGLDIERLDETRDLASLARQALDENEYEIFARAPTLQRTRSFYDIWSCKEALFKLRATAAAQFTPSFMAIPHKDLSIVLCADAALSTIDVRHVNVVHGQFIACGDC
jgi:4'-phosphopantetheinyl transferase